MSALSDFNISSLDASFSNVDVQLKGMGETLDTLTGTVVSLAKKLFLPITLNKVQAAWWMNHGDIIHSLMSILPYVCFIIFRCFPMVDSMELNTWTVWFLRIFQRLWEVELKIFVILTLRWLNTSHWRMCKCLWSSVVMGNRKGQIDV